MIQGTSLKAYYDILPELNKKQSVVFRVIVDRGPITNREIKSVLGWDINRITPRVKEMGVVELDRKRPCEITGRTAMAWKKSRGISKFALKESNFIGGGDYL